jgi:hypothetical protein
MTLFAAPSQHREKATISRVLSLLPLYAALADGYIWNWFAVNLPMDLGTGGTFTSDMDIVGRLLDHQSRQYVYRTWEVKVSLLPKDGSPRSLKSGKLGRTLRQLRAYRGFGSPHVSLLDVYVCETDFWRTNVFPLQLVTAEAVRKIATLRPEGFGYQWLPFGHWQERDDDVGTFTMPLKGRMRPMTHLLQARSTAVGDGFNRLVRRLHERFRETQGSDAKKHVITFCRACRRIQVVAKAEGFMCPACNSDLLTQS